ncbi:T6SS immunity protein Tli4 family protein [Chitinibacteraceae bacterium HSL-7]
MITFRKTNLLVQRSVLMLTFALVACSSSEAQSQQSQTSDAEAINAAFHPDYVQQPNTRSECLGRQVFDIPADPKFEWGLPSGADKDAGTKSNLGFSYILQGGQDVMHVGTMRVTVFDRSSEATVNVLLRSAEIDAAIETNRIKYEIESYRGLIDFLNSSMKNPEIKNDPKLLSGRRKEIREYQAKIQEAHKSLAKMPQYFHRVNLGIPGVAGYVSGDVVYAFLSKEQYAYMFMADYRDDGTSPNASIQALKALLNRFEYRPLYHVPSKMGLCVPHGFIADNGETTLSAEISYRYTDAPGVIYTLSTAVVGDQDYLQRNPPVLEATARSTYAGLAGSLNERKLKTIGPKSSAMGGRTALLGGVYAIAGPIGYSVYAASEGQLDSQIIPYVALNMRSFDKEMAPNDLDVNPPPFEPSMQRFETTLHSIRTAKSAVAQ